MNVHAARHVVVIAGDRVPASDLVSALTRRAEAGSIRVTVVCPVSEPAPGFVVYEDSRRDAARARLELVLDAVPGVIGSAGGYVVGEGVRSAVLDACAQLAPDEVIVCGRLPRRPFGGDAAEQLQREAGVPLTVIGEETQAVRGIQCVLAVASGALPGDGLLARLRVRSRISPVRITIACPSEAHHPRQLEVAHRAIREAGVDAHVYLAHPNACVAALHAVQERHVDEIVVAVAARTPRRRRARPEWISRATGLPVDAVVEELLLQEAA
jgi:hypothetical protein